MPKKYEVRNLILDALDERDVSRAELLQIVRKTSGLSVSEKTLNEALINLLKQNKIEVVGYDLSIYDGVKRVQSMKSDGIIFSRLINDQFEIGILITKLESDDIEVVRDVLYRLKIIFKNKINKLNIVFESNKDSDEVFNKIIRYINVQEETQKRIMSQKLALALSDEQDSEETLRQLIAFMRM